MEIERKYLVNKEKWSAIHKPIGELIIQGYLLTDINKTIRVRIIGSSGYIAVKGRTFNISREELEFPVSYEIAKELIDKFTDGLIEKIRFTLSFKGKTWEVDEFMGDNTGLLLAEVELQTEDEWIELPGWIEIEVSTTNRYFNSNLVVYPYKKWSYEEMQNKK